VVVEIFTGQSTLNHILLLFPLFTGAFCWVHEMLGFRFTALSTIDGRNNAPFVFAPLAMMT